MAHSTSTAKLRVQWRLQTSKSGEKSHPEAAAAKTGSRNMAEIAPMSSQIRTFYSTLYTLWGLSRLLLTVCRGAYCITPIIEHWRTRKMTITFGIHIPGEWSQNALGWLKLDLSMVSWRKDVFVFI